MSLAANIAPHLPYLRRFSRALTGSQHSGDAYVAALLEAIIADPSQFEAGSNMRASLYRSYCRLWESISLNLKKPNIGQDWEASAQRQLATIAPQAREAFLLMAVEGFTKEEIGIILAKKPPEILALLEEASKTIVDQVATDVLIIEDEPIIAMDLEALVESLGHRVTGVARTEQEAIKLASTKRPGLVLADIQLADGSSGIDAVNKMLRDFQVPVIFITAFPERLLMPMLNFLVFYAADQLGWWTVYYPSVFRINGWFMTIMGLNAIALLLRVVQRAYFVGSMYGWEHGLLSIPRMVIGNFINAMAAARAWRLFLSHKLLGTRLVWDKTMHDFPSADQLDRHRQRLGEVLLSWRAIDASHLQQALVMQRDSRRPLGAILLEQGWLDEGTLEEAILFQEAESKPVAPPHPAMQDIVAV